MQCFFIAFQGLRKSYRAKKININKNEIEKNIHTSIEASRKYY